MKPHLTARLSGRDALLALAVVFVWGTNFVVIRLGLDVLPPLFFATLRFVFVFFPACLFLPRAQVGWGNLSFYGLAIGLVQFGFLFIAMNGHIPPGLASLVVQMQVFFTIGLAIWRTGERIQPHQLLAFALGLAGMGLIAAHNGQGTTILGLVLVLGAALGWALGNQASREAGQAASVNPKRLQGSRAGPGRRDEEKHQVNMLAYVVWAAMFSVPPLLVLSLLLDGPAAIAAGLARATPLTWAAVLWQSVGNTMFGYAVWAWLLSRYPAATISPLSLLVPVFGIGASALLLHEPLPGWKIGAALLILAGLAVNLLWRPRKTAVNGEAA